MYEHFRDIYDQSQINNTQLEITLGSPEQNSPRSVTTEKKISFNSTESNAIIRIRGPCSSSMSYIFDDCQHVVLIGGGIGKCVLDI